MKSNELPFNYSFSCCWCFLSVLFLSPLHFSTATYWIAWVYAWKSILFVCSFVRISIYVQLWINLPKCEHARAIGVCVCCVCIRDSVPRIQSNWKPSLQKKMLFDKFFNFVLQNSVIPIYLGEVVFSLLLFSVGNVLISISVALSPTFVKSLRGTLWFEYIRFSFCCCCFFDRIFDVAAKLNGKSDEQQHERGSEWVNECRM